MRAYNDLVSLALALAVKKNCPICDTFRAWEARAEAVLLPFRDAGGAQAEPAVALVCKTCGYVLTLLCSHLDRNAAELERQVH